MKILVYLFVIALIVNEVLSLSYRRRRQAEDDSEDGLKDRYNIPGRGRRQWQNQFPNQQRPFPGQGQFPGSGQFPGQDQFPGQQGQFPGQFPGQGQFPNQGGQFPGQWQFPGQQGQFPGQQGQSPGQQAQFPGEQGQFPGQEGQFPGQQGQFPGQQGQFPDQGGLFPDQGLFPGQNGQGSSTQTPPGSSTQSPAIAQCLRNCPVTPEYNPVCGNDGVTYTNPGRLSCAQACGINVTLLRSSTCPSTTPAPAAT